MCLRELQPMKRLFIFLICILTSLLAACGRTPTPPAPRPPAPPIIFHNGIILTMEKDMPLAQAIAIQDEKIVAVGDNAFILALQTLETQVIDLNGRTLMPGFVDAHTHVLNDARSQDKSLDQAQMLALQNGITTLGDLYVDQSFLRDIQRFNAAGQLRVRTSLYLVYNGPCGQQIGTWYKNYPPTRAPGEMLRIGGVKIFTDGGSCGQVALSFEHADQGQGDLWMTQDELNKAVAEAQAAGYQVAIHAIGDRAVEQAQNAIAFALDGQPNTYRHRMEHVSVLRPEQVARFGELGIVPVLPGQYPSCTPFGPPLPEAYGKWEWPWAELRAKNPVLPIAWHSDYPFWSINPFVHLYGFVTRNDVYQHYTCKPQDWLQDDVLTVEQALSIMAIESAYALFREMEVGSLRPGKYADLIVISENPLTVEAEQLRRLSVSATLVGGRFEYCAGSGRDLCPGYVSRIPTPLPDLRPPVPIRWLTAILIVLVPLGLGLWGGHGRAFNALVGGVAGAIGGVLWIAAWWWSQGDWSGGEWLLIFVPALFALGVVGLLSIGRHTWLTRLSLIVTGLGAIAVAEGALASAWFKYDAGWMVMILGLLSHTVGLALFGLANLKTRIWPRLNAVPLIVGLFGGPVPFGLSFLLPQGTEWPLWMLVFVLGGGWLVMGGLLLIARPNFPTQIGPRPHDNGKTPE